MTRVEFYFNVADKQILLTELVKHALLKRRRVTVFTANTSNANSVADYLWQSKQDSFLPNVAVNHVYAAKTPVLIAC